MPAGNIRLTLQSDIQWYAEQACAAQVKATKARNCTDRGDAARRPVTSWRSRSTPAFNPAAPQSVAATSDIPVQNVFQPGSTGKVITVAAALEHGGQTPMSTYTVPDHIVVDGFPFHDAEAHPTPRYTIAGILANSINDGMVQVVQHVSPQVQYQYFRAFGLGQPTGLNLPGESAGILPAPAKWWGDERYTLSFGQGVAANAVQMASVYATIANGGVRVQPAIVAGHHERRRASSARARPPATRRVLTSQDRQRADDDAPAGAEGQRAGRRAVGDHPRILGRGQDRHRAGARSAARRLPVPVRFQLHRHRPGQQTRSWWSR